MLIHSGCVALSPERSEARADNKEVASLYREDQGARVALGTNVALWSNLSGSDLERRMRVKALYAAGQLHTGSDFYCAAMVLQHGVTSDDYLLAHEFSIIALAKGEPRAKWLAAATEDRFLMQIKRPQRFGTQFYMKPDQQWELYTTADSVTNQLRAQLGVPPLAEAKEKQTRLNLKHTADKTKPEADEELTPNRTPLVVDEAKPAAGPPGGGELIDEAIVGSWQGLTPNGAPVEFEFMPDHRVTWQSYLGTVHGRYDLAPAGDLFEIDLYSFDHPQLRGERLVAIARVESGKLFFEAASMKEAEAQSIPLRRPKSFGEEVMQLICKK
ncbi:MAG: hypothetical protein HZA31_14055 [Opitutae bacterium]|nr:hypothetical protein [Opitutae bacterium]